MFVATSLPYPCITCCRCPKTHGLDGPALTAQSAEPLTATRVPTAAGLAFLLTLGLLGTTAIPGRRRFFFRDASSTDIECIVDEYDGQTAILNQARMMGIPWEIAHDSLCEIVAYTVAHTGCKMLRGDPDPPADKITDQFMNDYSEVLCQLPKMGSSLAQGRQGIREVVFFTLDQQRRDRRSRQSEALSSECHRR